MPTEPSAPLRGRYLEALRAMAVSPGGIRLGAFPTFMPVLVELGYAREGMSRTSPREPVWLLTRSGRDLVRALGRDAVSGET